MAKKKNVELVRVSINLPSSIVEKVKDFGESLGLNTTSAYIVLLNQALEQKDMLNQLPNLMNALTTMQQLTNTEDK